MMKNYSMLFYVLVALYLAHGTAGEQAIGAGYAQTFNGCFQTGYSYTFRDYVDNLSELGFNDAICSVRQTGMWMYYENSQYNKYYAGKVYWVHGVDIEVNFPPSYNGITSSLKYGGNRHYLNEDSFTLYAGSYFTGDEFYGNIDTPDLTIVSGQSSSLVITGPSPWTFYTGYSYTGRGYCVYPSFDLDQGADGTVLNFGIYETLSSYGMPENKFRSVAKGCYPWPNLIRPDTKARNSSAGAWGFVDMAQDQP